MLGVRLNQMLNHKCFLPLLRRLQKEEVSIDLKEPVSLTSHLQTLKLNHRYLLSLLFAPQK
jgi:hypothetical protein